MKLEIKYAIICLVLMMIVYLSCKKELSCEDCAEKNKPPIAVAGPNQVITLPTDSVLLNGSASSDPDGTISGYLWTKISGPASFTIVKPSDSVTKVRTLDTGIYQFELKVTDAGGLFSKDTMQVIVDAVLTNYPPAANAGADQMITLPTNAVNLDGSTSTDPENNIASYAWAKISGPSSSTIVSPNLVQTQVTNLVQGIYQFELKVTDTGGLFSRDTVQVVVNVDVNNSCDINNRPLVNAQLVPFATLSQERYGMAVASAGNKIVFAGGYAVSGNSLGYSGASRVDIYDVVTHNWSTAELSQPREKMAVAISGNKIFFAGGEEHDFDDGGITLAYSNVDIYDASTNSWSVSSLSVPRRNLVGGSVGNKVFFAGGNSSFFNHPGPISAVVDIYDLSTNAWSTSSLSQPRENLSAATVGNKIYFAGGNAIWSSISNRIDIYDNGIGAWSTSTLNEPKTNMACIAFGGKIYWSGGHNSGTTVSSQVEIKDLNTQTSSLNCLYKPTEWYQFPNSAVEKNNKIVFFSGINHDPSKFDIYDIITNTWSIGSLSFYTQYAAIISVNNTIYVANGTKVWKLEF